METGCHVRSSVLLLAFTLRRFRGILLLAAAASRELNKLAFIAINRSRVRLGVVHLSA